MKCPYCHREAKKVTGKSLYPARPDLWKKQFYRCHPCDAHVGCHANSGKPFGSLADSRTRALRRQAHAAFDPMWKSGKMGRKEAYSWLAEKLGIAMKKCHIAYFDGDTCLNVIDVCKDPDQYQ